MAKTRAAGAGSRPTDAELRAVRRVRRKRWDALADFHESMAREFAGRAPAHVVADCLHMADLYRHCDRGYPNLDIPAGDGLPRLARRAAVLPSASALADF